MIPDILVSVGLPHCLMLFQTMYLAPGIGFFARHCFICHAVSEYIISVFEGPLYKLMFSEYISFSRCTVNSCCCRFGISFCYSSGAYVCVIHIPGTAIRACRGSRTNEPPFPEYIISIQRHFPALLVEGGHLVVRKTENCCWGGINSEKKLSVFMYPSINSDMSGCLSVCKSVWLSQSVCLPVGVPVGCLSAGTNNDSFELLQENSKSHCGHRVGIAHTRWATHGKQHGLLGNSRQYSRQY